MFNFSFFVQFIKFGIVGLSNTAISYGVYALLTFLGCFYLLSNVIAFIVSVFNSFFWNNKFVFKKEEGTKRNILWTLCKTFLSYAGTGLVLSNIMLFIFVEKWNMSKYIAPLLVLIVTIPLNFIINKYWAFRSKSEVEVSENGRD